MAGTTTRWRICGSAAAAGRKHGAIGYLNTEWGDGGHPQPLAVNYLPYLAGAALSWCAKTFDEKLLVPVLGRDVFYDSTGRVAKAAYALGFAHRKLGVFAPNETPLGTVIAAPPPERRELFCRNGLKYYARIPAQKIRAVLREIERHGWLCEKHGHKRNQVKFCDANWIWRRAWPRNRAIHAVATSRGRGKK